MQTVRRGHGLRSSSPANFCLFLLVWPSTPATTSPARNPAEGSAATTVRFSLTPERAQPGDPGVVVADTVGGHRIERQLVLIAAVGVLELGRAHDRRTQHLERGAVGPHVRQQPAVELAAVVDRQPGRTAGRGRQEDDGHQPCNRSFHRMISVARHITPLAGSGLLRLWSNRQSSQCRNTVARHRVGSEMHRPI